LQQPNYFIHAPAGVDELERQKNQLIETGKLQSAKEY